ncbi:MAG TPA: phospholipid carrier-dependent glycosyltransferase [Thermoanaerobaculia bacterium]
MTAIFLGLHLLALALLAATAYVAGRLVLRGLEGLEGIAVSTALGLTLLAHLMLALGALGLLTRTALIVLIVAIHLLGVGTGLAPAREGLNPSPTSLKVGLLLAAAPLFLLALYPPTAFDETLYHLPYARAFASTGGIPFLPELRYPIFPQLAEMLFTGMLLLAGDVATHLVQLLATLITAALLIAWGGKSGWVAAAAFLGNPIIVHLAGTAYVEPVLTLFATASVYALERWRETRARSWLILLGVFAGSAASVKYLGLFFVGAALAALIPAGRLRGLAVASAAALAVLVPWYGRLILHTGNPLFPFYPRLFGANPWFPDPVSRTLMERASAYLQFPWDVLLDRASAGNQPPWSPVYLFGIPLLAYGLVRDARVRRILGIALAYSLLLFVLPPDSRYMTAVLPLLSLALALTLARFPLRKWMMPALAVLLFLPGWTYGIYRIAREGPLPATARERDLYLTRKLPAYAAVNHLNRLHPEGYTAYALFAENMVYHADGTLLGDWSGPARYSHLLPAFRDPKQLEGRLRRMGADYLLIPRGKGVFLPEGSFRRIYSDRWTDLYQLP